MPLDENLFTLKFRRSPDGEPGAIDLEDPQGNVYYRKRLVNQANVAPSEIGPQGAPLYDLWDPLSNSLLSTLCAQPSSVSKKRTVQLYNPSALVDVTFTGSISFRWQFTWETHTFEFKKEEVFLLRKPDPPVLVAVYEFERKQNRPDVGLVQLMDYNLTRFDIEDRKGLEIVMLTGLLSFQEAISGQPSDNAGGDPAALSNAKSSSSSPGGVSPSGGPVPQLPPKDAGMKVAGLQIREKSAPNEVIVSSMFEIEEYAEYACGLLQDDKMLYIVVRSKTAAEVPKVVAIASMVKRMRYKGGAHDEELHQYAKYEEEEAKKGPRVIKLDQPAKDPYRPPAALSIHLSKIPMPELQPRARPVERTVSNAPSRSSLHVPEPSSKRSGRSRSQEPRRDGEANLSSSGDRRTILSKNKPPKDSGTNKPPPKDSSFTPGALQSQGHHPRPPPRPHVQAPDQPSSSQPLSPRSSFWGFYNPGSVASPKTPTPPPPQHHQHHHRASSPPHGKPPKPSRQPSGGSNPTDNMPGHFPSAGGAAAKPPAPPPPPPQGMSSLLGGILPNSSSSSSSTQGGGTSNSLGTTASLMGSLGMHMYDRLTKRQ